ncbi:MAG: TadE/TadG family type IV pilus assembly protein [Thermodesulfobacteriota bacterium]|nr:TadE/TadG family type IV pilus assembly protein [Thermodesulfobacteriota bacterium]
MRLRRKNSISISKGNSILRSISGQGMVEMLVVLPVMLLLILATIQMALIYHAKITLNYAVYEAVRAGTLNCDKQYQQGYNGALSSAGQYAAVQEGLARGLAPLYSYFEPDSSKHSDMHDPAKSQVEAFQQGRDRVYADMKSNLDLVRIERLSPSEKTFTDFAIDGVIPNDNLMYRSSSSGRESKSSIQSANILHIRVTYWYPLYVPMVNKLMFNTFICGRGLGGGFFSRWASHPACRDGSPRIPLTATAAMRMQVPGENSSGWYTQ